MIKDILQLPYRTSPFTIRASIHSLASYMIASKRGCKNISKIDFGNVHDRVCVLGNGPSLQKDKAVLQSIKDKNDFLCVNNFCDDELYTILKPKIYVFLDPYFFSHNAHPDWVTRRVKTFETMNDTTIWPMTVLVPFYADLNVLKEYITNPNIKIIRTNTQALQTTYYSKVVELCFDTGIYAPPPSNVLVYAIFTAITAKYKHIKIFGADLSFHNDVRVSSKTNQLYIERKHFNEPDTIEVLKRNPEKVKEIKMSELLTECARTFTSHNLLQQYAQSKGVSITNHSSYSLIDAYPRPELSE